MTLKHTCLRHAAWRNGTNRWVRLLQPVINPLLLAHPLPSAQCSTQASSTASSPSAQLPNVYTLALAFSIPVRFLLPASSYNLQNLSCCSRGGPAFLKSIKQPDLLSVFTDDSLSIHNELLILRVP